MLVFRLIRKGLDAIKDPEPEKTEVKPIVPFKMEWSDYATIAFCISLALGYMLYKHLKGTLEL